MIYNPFTVVVVPFPFTDLSRSKKRPALVISSKNHQKENEVITLLMITTAHHNAWFGDYLIKDLNAAGLPFKSIVRQKIFTIDRRLVIKEIGTVSKIDRQAILARLDEHLALQEM